MRDGLARDWARSVGTKRIRCDGQAADSGSNREYEQNANLLEQFRSWIWKPSHDHRRATRHAARMYRVWLGWWQGETEFYALTARLANISRGGALVFVQRPPPERHSVWICLGTPEPDECLAATALEVRRARRGECSVRVAFGDPCPSRFLEAAVCGRVSLRPG